MTDAGTVRKHQLKQLAAHAPLSTHSLYSVTCAQAQRVVHEVALCSIFTEEENQNQLAHIPLKLPTQAFHHSIPGYTLYTVINIYTSIKRCAQVCLCDTPAYTSSKTVRQVLAGIELGHMHSIMPRTGLKI